jgi:CHAT domain-containing protein/Tfp pilus assembly protein PilF
MVLALIFAAALTHSAQSQPLLAECTELVVGKPLSVIIAPSRHACVKMELSQGEATQIVADAVADLALHVTGPAESLTDGFEFDRETVTLNLPGRYRIEIINRAKDATKSSLTVPMLLNPISLQVTEQWQQAELSATVSKQSGTVKDISASLELWQALGDASAVARTWLKLGDAKLSADPSSARDAYEQAFNLCHTLNELRCIAEAANNSGLAARQLGDFNGSLNRLQEAVQDWETLHLPTYQGKTFSNLGILYSRTGDFQKAVNNYNQAIAILKKRDLLGYAKTLNNLGLSYLSLAQYDRGAENLDQAIKIERSLKGAEADLFRTRMNLGRAFMLEGRLNSARSVLGQTLEIARTRPDRYLLAYTLNNLGQTLLRLRQFHAAEENLQDSLTLYRQMGDKRGEALALHYLGVIARKMGNVPHARDLLGQALQLRRDYGMRDDAADSLYELASLEFAAGESQRAVSLATEAIPMLESVRSHVPGAALRASFYARRRNLLDLLVTITMRPDNANAAVDGLIAAELGRGRALLDLIADRHLYSGHPQALAERQIKTRREIDLLLQQAVSHPADYDKVKARVQVLITEDEEAEADILKSLGNSEPGAQPLSSVSGLQSEVLSPRSAILEYQLGEQASHLWLIRDHQIEVFPLPPRTIIEKQVANALKLFDKVNERRRDPAKQASFHDAMYLLSNKLLGPLQNRSLPQLVILVLDGDLHRVPFAALQLPSGDYLGLHHDLLRAPSAAFLMQAPAPRSLSAFQKTAIAFYDPVFSLSDHRVPKAVQNPAAPAGLARLPFGNELNTISGLAPPARRDFFGGLDATARKLRSANLSSYAIVQFSTHAVINDQTPEMSSIALSVVDREGHPVSGLVLPFQLAGLSLNRSVVVLSACDTALGKKVLGEGMIGFTSSLFSAGASRLVLTLSEVNAEASSVFLSETYSHFLATGGMSMEHSLTLARQALQRSDRWSDPYYWASFVEVGAPARTYRRQKDGSN